MRLRTVELGDNTTSRSETIGTGDGHVRNFIGDTIETMGEGGAIRGDGPVGPALDPRRIVFGRHLIHGLERGCKIRFVSSLDRIRA